MKKILLFAAAAVIAVSASAQMNKKSARMQSKTVVPAQMQKQQSFKAVDAKNAAVMSVDRNFGQQVALTGNLQRAAKGLMNVKSDVSALSLAQKMNFDQSLLSKSYASKSPRKTSPTDLKDSYQGNAYKYNSTSKNWEAVDTWEVLSDTVQYDGQAYYCLDEILPPGVFSGAVKYMYGMSGDTLSIDYGPYAPYKNTYYVYAMDYTDFKNGGDGSIKLVLGSDGSLVVPAENANHVYGWFAATYNSDYTPKAIYGAFAQYADLTYTAGGSSEDTFVATQSYTGKGKDLGDNVWQEWKMAVGKDSGYDVVRNISPSIFSDSDMDALATVNGNLITIAPQKIAQTSSYYLYLASGTASDGTITLTRDATTGYITVPEGESIVIGAFTTDAFDPNYGDTYAGYWQITQNVAYYAEGQEIPAAAPTVYAEAQEAGALFAGLSESGYRYTNNIVLMPAYADMTIKNYTTDEATGWDWSAKNMTYNSLTGDYDVKKTVTSQDKDFVLSSEEGLWQDIVLKGINGQNVSEPDSLGVGAEKPKAFFYASGSASSFAFQDETYPCFSSFDPNGDLTFYTNWATPEKASNSMSKIYIYGCKPAKPLYITGINLPCVNWSNTTDFNLTCKLVKCTRNGRKVTLGDVIAQCDATAENVDATYSETSGIAVVDFNNFYTTDEEGMSTDIDHLFLDDEFLIEIDGWDNGTFTAVLGSEDNYNALAPYSTWFEMSGEEGSMYSYTSWMTRLFVGYDNATYGYLHTTDNTDVTIPTTGGSATIHVEPMLCSVDGTTGAYTTRLFTEDEIPEWLTLSFANESYTDNGFSFDLVAAAEALPEGTTGRQAKLRLFQEGACIDLVVTQGVYAGINTVTTTVAKVSDGKTYNLAGQRVDRNAKGIVVCGGKKTYRN